MTSPLPARSLAGTRVTFPTGATSGVSTITAMLNDADDGRLLVITDETPFHPVDPLWADQPGDRGRLCLDGVEIPVLDSITVAHLPNGTTLVDHDIDITRDSHGVNWLVGHRVDRHDLQLVVGAEIELHVDAGRRLALSASHTACHLVALALNQSVAHLWRKGAPVDSRGYPNLDAVACVHSHHELDGSVDRYRLGKSLRRRGFASDRLLEDPTRYADAISATVNQWLSTRADVRIERDGPLLSDRRNWVCDLPGGAAQMPCGGTHPTHLGEIARVSVAATATADGSELVLRTTTTVAPV